MSKGSRADYFPSLLDRLTERRRDQAQAAALEKEIAALDRRLAQADTQGITRSEKFRLEQHRRRLLDQLELLRGLTQSWDDIRDCVRRDLDWLFNAHALAPAAQLDAYPQVRRSVLNLGLPDLSGKTATAIDPRALEAQLEEIIAAFEPRILRRSLKVHLDLEASDLDHNSLILEIQGRLWAQPTPFHLRLRSRLDLDEDIAQVIEFQT